MGNPADALRQMAGPAATVSPRYAPTAPDYRGLQIGSTILGAIAWLYYLASAIFIIAALLTVFGPRVQTQSSAFVLPPLIPPAFMFVMYGIGSLTAGGVSHALSAGCSALRDIARNSYR